MLTRRTFIKLAAASTAVLLPVSTVFAALPEVLEDLELNLDDAKGTVADSAGPLPEPAKSAVAALLVSALTGIDQALNTSELGGFVGDVETSYSDASLPDVAATCATLARYSRNEELHGRTGWEQRCVNHLATIKDLINRADTGYKARAGIA
jgi:hypothetical protein